MRKVATFLCAAVALALVVPASAQAPDMFKDLDTSHWAYQAVENLRAKNIVWGYPDGYFRGKRTLTRYEFAVALDRALKSIPPPGTGPAGPKGDKGDTGERGAQGDVGPAGPQGPPGMTPQEVADFRRLMEEFRRELGTLGNSVSAINRKVDALDAQVKAINARLDKMPTIYGLGWFGIQSDRADGGYVDYNGRPFGIGGPGGSGLVNTPAVVHTFGLGVKANIAGGATLDAMLTSNNYKNYLGGNTAIVTPLNLGGPAGGTAADTYIHHLEISTPFGGLGRGSKFTIGRFGERLGHFTLWKPDVDRYFMNPLEDDGYYHIDGVKLDTNFGSVNVSAFGGQTRSVTGTDGVAWNRPAAGILPGAGEGIFGGGPGLDKPFGQAQGDMLVDQMAGITLGMGFNALGGGHVRFTALDTSAERSTPTFGYTNVLVLGADFDLKIANRFTLTGDWGKTNIGSGRFDTINAGKNNAFDARLGFTTGGLNLTAGYRYIDPLFYAPGYWGRIGNWLNPTNVQGPTFRAGYDFSPSFGLNLGGDFYSAARNNTGNNGLSRDDEINRVLVGLRWDVAKNFRTTVDWEGVYWSLDKDARGGSGTVHPTEQYITLGTGYNLTSNTLLKLNYTIGDFNGKGFLTTASLPRYNFNTFTAQVGVKF